MIHLYCGDGKGKTTAACGLALRCLGRGKKVVLAQFFKNDTSGEIGPLRALGATVLHADVPMTFEWKMDEEGRERARASMCRLLERALEAAQDADLLVLDEVVSAYRKDMIDRERLLRFLRGNPQAEVVLTGRNPPPELSDLADYHSEICKRRHPKDRGVRARKGIEF